MKRRTWRKRTRRRHLEGRLYLRSSNDRHDRWYVLAFMRRLIETLAGMTCAIETWWGGSRRWERCKLKATDGRYCLGHAWANTSKPFWDGGSTIGGSLIHRSVPLKGGPHG